MEIEGSTLTPEEMRYFHKTIGPDEVLTADDTYPAEPLGLTVYGSTRQNLWVNPSGTRNGITVTANDDGSIDISGTAAGGTGFAEQTTYALRPGTTYTVSCNKSVIETAGMGYGGIWVASYDSDDVLKTYVVIGGDSLSAVYTVPTDSVKVVLRIDFAVGTTANVHGLRVMLNEGDTAEPWCPPGLNSVSEVSAVLAGKNLLKANGVSAVNSPSSTDKTATSNGLTCTLNDDGTVHVKGTATSNTKFYLSLGVSGIKIPDGWTVTVSGLDFVRFYDKGEQEGNKEVGDHLSFQSTSDSGLLFAWISIEQGSSVDNMYYPQLELGSTATEYEPPNVNTVPIDLQGNELCGLPDGTRDELRIDESGAVTLVKRVGSVDLDGSQNWTWQADVSSAYFERDEIARDTDYTDQMLCDKLPVKKNYSSSVDMPQYISGYHSSTSNLGKNWVYARTPRANDAASVKSWFASSPTLLLYKLAKEQEIPLDTVTLPTLPAPNLTAYADADVPCDMELEYVYDPYYGYSDLLHGMSWLRVDYDGDDESENYSSRVDLGGNRLFALSDELKDELDVISGTIRKRTMYGVLVGAESWSEKTDSTGSQHKAYYQMDIAGGSFSPKSDEQGGLFGRLKTKDPKSNDGPCAYCFADSTGIHIRMRPLASAVAGLDGFKDWLSKNHVPYVRYLFEGEEDLSITPVNLPELYDPDVTVGISFG